MLVRSCEGTYSEEELTKAHIKVEVSISCFIFQELIFPDGQLPSSAIINKWLKIVDEFFDGPNANHNVVPLEVKEESKDAESSQLRKKTNPSASSNERRIGVHCVAGLGRAPLLVALALVNKGCTPVNTIELIRKNRKGALNVIQANYILEYKPQRSGKQVTCECSIF